MGILDRIAAAFTRQPSEGESPLALPEHRADAGAMSPRAQASMSTIMRNQGSQKRGDAAVLAAYNESPYLRAAIGGLSETVAAVPWRLYAGSPDTRGHFTRVRGDLTERAAPARHKALSRAVAAQEVTAIRTHPLLTLLDEPNPYMTGRVARQVTIAQLKLIGTALWVLDGEDEQPPLNAFPVPGTWVKRRPTPEQPTWEIDVNGATWNAPVDRVLVFTSPDPANPYGMGSGIGTTLRNEIDIDEHAAQMVVGFFQNRAMPDALISIRGASRAVLERAKHEWNNARQGFRRAYGNQWTSGEIQVERLDTAFKDMQLVELRRAQRDVFQQATGRPPEKMGIVTNSNKATALAASIIDATDVQVPLLEVMREQFQRLARAYDDRLYVEYENPIPDDIEAKRAAMTAVPGAFRIDEIRMAHDEEPLGPDDGGSGVIVNGRWFASPKDVKPEAATLAPVAAIPDDEPDAPKPDAVESDAAPTASPASEALNGAQVASLLEIVGKVVLGEIPKDTAKAMIAAAFPFMTEEQINKIVDPIEVKPPAPAAAPPAQASAPPAARAHVRIDDKMLREILRAIDVDSMGDPVEEAVRAMIEDYGQEALDALGVDAEFVSGGAVNRKMKRLRSQRIDGMVNGTTRAALADALRGADMEVGSLEDTVTSLFNSARESRAPMIATTETVVHGEWATLEGAKQSGLDLVREWITTLDGLQRDSHDDLDGQAQPLDKPFKIPSGPNAGAEAMAPGGFGIASEDINCRCTTSIRVADGAKSARGKRAHVVRDLGALAPRAEETRADFWRRIDNARKPWEKKVTDAVIQGFDAQERAVIEAIRKLSKE